MDDTNRRADVPEPDDEAELDALLREADRLIDGDAPEAPEEDPWEDGDFTGDIPDTTQVYHNFGNRYGQDIRNFSNHYGRQPREEDEDQMQGERDQGPKIRAYNVDFVPEQDRRDPPRRKTGQPRPVLRPVRRTEPEYEDDGAWDGGEEDSAPQDRKTGRAGRSAVPGPRRKRKRHGLLRFLAVLLVLAAVGILALYLTVKQPVSDVSAGVRKPGCSVILLAGADQDGTRTDTMMLLFLDSVNKKVNLISLPRDTLTVTAAGNHAKLNSAYGRNGSGEKGMEGLLDYVQEIIGFRPDGYLQTDLDAFVTLVDQMGGVKFDVPMDMYYDDPSQNLHIDLKEGMQKLDGEQAMGLVRFRSGYAMADLKRVEVQREFVAAAMDQWLSVKNIFRAPGAISTLTSSLTGNLSKGNLLWLALNAWKAGRSGLKMVTLPGEAQTVYGASYYLLDAEQVADAVNEYCNPYQKKITAADLKIAQ